MKRPVVLIVGAAAGALLVAAVGASAHTGLSLTRMIGVHSAVSSDEASGTRLETPEPSDTPEATEAPEATPTAEPTEAPKPAETENDTDTDTETNDEHADHESATGAANEGGTNGHHGDGGGGHGD